MASESDHVLQGPGKLPGPAATSTRRIPTEGRPAARQTRKRAEKKKARKRPAVPEDDNTEGPPAAADDEHEIDYLV